MYKHILVAVDLSNDTKSVIESAQRMASGSETQISLVHVIEPVAAAYSMDIYALNVSELQEEAVNYSKERISELASQYNITSENTHALLGMPASEIRCLAKELDVDAIVIGSHGHSGWKILLGSTAIKVLHGATCDVLTVYVGEE